MRWFEASRGLVAALTSLAFSEFFIAPGAAAENGPAAPAKLTFNEHIQPILAENCYHCHGPDPGSRKDGLRLDRAEFAFKPHKDSGPAILAGQPDKSPLVLRIETTNEKERMPPAEAHKTLKPAEIALLRRWVAEGAEYQEHWAFVAPRRPAVPAVSARRAGEVRTPVDAFLLARLEKEKLEPSPEAEPRALLRRVSYDLTGLPPTLAELDAFLSDRAPGAYERAVDRLLASPHFGEHRARYWLDYVRYADTHGLHFDNLRAIWPYRDYVIRSFNANKPFDRFVREQLAGDLLPGRTLDDFVATGFMRCNLTTNEGGTITEEIYVNQTRDRVEAFGGTFLGLTTGCAACHDHKFDPITQKDFYGLAAFLNNTAEKPWDLNAPDPAPVVRLPRTAEERTVLDAALVRRAAAQASLDARRSSAGERLRDWLASGERPQPVSPAGLELRLRCDEQKGDVVHNSAPGARRTSFQAEVNPLVWGEYTWMWPIMRLDITTRLALGDIGDVDTSDAFSAGGWFMLRQKTGGGGAGNGALLARRGDDTKWAGRGWEIYQKDQILSVSLVHDSAGCLLQLETVKKYPRYEWLHVFFTYDGSGRAAGLRLYVNGEIAPVRITADDLGPEKSIRTPAVTYLGRRDDADPMRETSYQDIRVYRRALAAAEVARLPFEDVAAEIVARQPDPARWTTDERFVALDRYFLGQVDPEARRLAVALAEAETAVEQAMKTGQPTLIARERSTPAYADILKRGDYYARVGRVEPLVPHFLPPLPAGAATNRLGLADWLLTADQPLFARVTVNRMWQEIFGTGLVDSPGDFGVMGSAPSHPELLDWLAVEFRESGWDLKKFYRLLVTSASYRQSARVRSEALALDPANRLLGRGPRFRMDGEVLRDAALATSGLLVDRIGGPPVRPFQPFGLWEEVAMPESNTRTYVADGDAGLYRRSLYTFWKRASPPPALETFDAPSREVVCSRRPRSNTPLQAFVTMNDQQWVEAARKLAERAMSRSPDLAQRLDFLAESTLARPLRDSEKRVLEKSLDDFRTHFRRDHNAALQFTGVGLAESAPQLDRAELASWTMVASQFYNLDEFLTK